MKRKRILAILCATRQALTQSDASKLAPIHFTGTTLQKCLRVVISEDHYAPVFGIAFS